MLQGVSLMGFLHCKAAMLHGVSLMGSCIAAH
jgi:hypothetical protein